MNAGEEAAKVVLRAGVLKQKAVSTDSAATAAAASTENKLVQTSGEFVKAAKESVLVHTEQRKKNLGERYGTFVLPTFAPVVPSNKY